MVNECSFFIFLSYQDGLVAIPVHHDLSWAGLAFSFAVLGFHDGGVFTLHRFVVGDLLFGLPLVQIVFCRRGHYAFVFREATHHPVTEFLAHLFDDEDGDCFARGIHRVVSGKVFGLVGWLY